MKTINPIQSYLTWLTRIPVPQARYIAYMFFLSTTENTADMVMEYEESLVRFKNYLVREDFPLRVLTRMVIVRDITNLIVKNHEVFTSEQQFAQVVREKEADNVVFLSPRQWEKTWVSWQEIYYHILSDQVFSLWLRTITKNREL
jgi:hypothetical protein